MDDGADELAHGGGVKTLRKRKASGEGAARRPPGGAAAATLAGGGHARASSALRVGGGGEVPAPLPQFEPARWRPAAPPPASAASAAAAAAAPQRWNPAQQPPRLPAPAPPAGGSSPARQLSAGASHYFEKLTQELRGLAREHAPELLRFTAVGEGMLDHDPLFARPGAEEEEEEAVAGGGGRAEGPARQEWAPAAPLALVDSAEWDDLDAEFPVSSPGKGGAGGQRGGAGPATTGRFQQPPQRRAWAVEPEEEDEWPLDEGPAQRRRW